MQRTLRSVFSAVFVVGVIGSVMGSVGCLPDPAPVDDGGADGFDAAQRTRALQLISVFENGTPELQYGYVEDLDDGRGFTCGLGFTTATGDAHDVVVRYQDAVGDNVLTPFLPELERLASLDEGDGADDTSGLNGFADAWQAASADAEFRVAEDAVVDDNNVEPALAHWRDLGHQSALSLFALLDAVWMHGDGDDLDGVPALIDRTCVDPADEENWLRTFLAVRANDMLQPANTATKEEWTAALPRIDVQEDLLNDGNVDLDGPIDVGHGFDVTVE